MIDSAWPALYLWPWAALTLSVLATLVHAWEETAGAALPLHAYFGRAAGVRVPDRPGLFLTAVALPLALSCAAAPAYLLGGPFWLSLLCGARLGDALFSHALPALRWRPNPGLYSSLYYWAEGGLILALAEVRPAPALLAAGAFALVLPLLWLLGRLGLLSEQTLRGN